MKTLEKKNIIITGGSGGIGSSLIDFLIKKNYQIFNFDLKPCKNKKVTNFTCDLTDPKKIQSNFLKFKKKYKTVFGLINCAGFTASKNALLFDMKKWNQTIAINLTAPFLFSQLAANLMKSKKVKGSIVNITSISADLPMPNSIAYNVSKAGLKNLTKSYAIDFANCGIRINNLSPGYTRTKMTKKSWNNKKERLKRTNKTTLLRWGNPEDYNEAVDFLIDSKKSGYMTGSDLIIDGGWTIKGM